jgi:serine/threonine-protein kinase HipA
MQEPNRLRVLFLGQPMAELAHLEGREGGVFALAFESSFLAKRHDLSPLRLALDLQNTAPSTWKAGDTPFIGGLPGLIADSLPDAWGERMLAQELPGLTTVLGKLSAIGPRGFGALSFEPIIGSGALDEGISADLPKLAQEAAELTKSSALLDKDRVTRALATGGSTLGGAYPKISTHLPLQLDGVLKLHDLRVGGPPPKGYAPSILKLTRSNDEFEGAVEYAFWLMANKAGIRTPRACLVDDGARLHFAVERFDRYLGDDGSWDRRHVHSLSGMLHKRAADRAIDYEEMMRLSRNLVGAEGSEECFRRVVFNLLSTNRDDHGRNHAFLYNEQSRTWSLAPAFDMNPSVFNQLIALSFMGSAIIPTEYERLAEFAAVGGISAKKAKAIYDQVEDAVIGGWPKAAKAAQVPGTMAALWGKEIKNQTKSLRASARRT